MLINHGEWFRHCPGCCGCCREQGGQLPVLRELHFWGGKGKTVDMEANKTEQKDNLCPEACWEEVGEGETVFEDGSCFSWGAREGSSRRHVWLQISVGRSREPCEDRG